MADDEVHRDSNSSPSISNPSTPAPTNSKPGTPAPSGKQESQPIPGTKPSAVYLQNQLIGGSGGDNRATSSPAQIAKFPYQSPGITMPPTQHPSKYTQFLAVIEDVGRDIRPSYAGNKASMERLKRGIVHARILVRECLMECERSARS